MHNEQSGHFDRRGLNSLAREVMTSLAVHFPVCMASDEFHFFPQAVADRFAAAAWDDFSPQGVTAFLNRLKRWRRSLAPFLSPPASFDQTVEAAMLRRVLKTLGEQFELVQVHRTQPTFYLTVVGIGLAEAAPFGGRFWTRRLAHLPGFLDQARQNLTDMPRLFRDIGLTLLTKQRAWLNALDLPDSYRTPVFQAFERLRRHLEQAPVKKTFLPDVGLYERIVADHLGCQLTLDAVATELEAEITQTQSILQRAAERHAPDTSWQAVVERLSPPATPPEGLAALYRAAIDRLASHCQERRLVSDDLVRQCPVKVEPIPAYLRPVRSNAAYSMPPRHPPAGGTFYILESDKSASVPVDYELLTAHETYPGHHLLDARRWGQERVVRRQVEFPLFYEGWASFAEELMFETGFFRGRTNRMLMAKRRFWRAVRGRIDFDIHTRRQSIDEAASRLAAMGVPAGWSSAMVRRYCLKPGYQLAYTIGRRRFRRLYEARGRQNEDPALFARRVLAQGEVGFDHLEQVLRQGG